jgi:hypothetical protein
VHWDSPRATQPTPPRPAGLARCARARASGHRPRRVGARWPPPPQWHAQTGTGTLCTRACLWAARPVWGRDRTAAHAQRPIGAAIVHARKYAAVRCGPWLGGEAELGVAAVDTWRRRPPDTCHVATRSGAPRSAAWERLAATPLRNERAASPARSASVRLPAHAQRHAALRRWDGASPLCCPRPHRHRNSPRPAHICTGTRLRPAHIGTGTRLRPAHIGTGTRLAPLTSAPELASPRPHRHRDSASPRPHRHRDSARSVRRVQRTRSSQQSSSPLWQ